MIKTVTINDFLLLQEKVVLADVRTPAEFAHGHIPCAFNLPLFSNEERVAIGTTYKQIGREEAILLGFDLTGPKWSGFIKQALEIAPGKKIGIHCWRGGMRSGVMSWVLDLYGFEVYLIKGGYKHYRNWVHQQFKEQYELQLLGGRTGSGKTRLLHQLRQLGAQVIDLEDLAQHQGSAYGSMGRMVQPSQEQFENNLAEQLKALDQKERVWVEDESLAIGKRFIPVSFWKQMREAEMIDIQVGIERRIASLALEYGSLDKDFLVASTARIHKRLGPEQTRDAIAAIEEGRMDDFVGIVLVYYDKTYRTGLSMRNPAKVQALDLTGTDLFLQANQILNFKNGSYNN